LRAEAAAQNIEPRMLGPVAAPMPKLRDNFRFHMLLYHTDQPALLEVVRTATDTLKAPEEVIWIVDVDPVDML
jgi:primosomal protein N' (replication factor Y)